MDWENERYVRVYVRDTPDLLAIGWEGRATLFEIMRKADRSGVIEYDGDVAMLAELLRMPVEVVEPGLEKLIRREVIERGRNALVIRNFIEAQEAKQSDAQRQRESRAQRRTRAVTKRDSASRNVTDCHEQSQPVTSSHSLSRSVTLAELSLAELSNNATSARARDMAELEAEPPPQQHPAETRNGQPRALQRVVERVTGQQPARDLEPVRARYEALGKELDPSGWKTGGIPARTMEIGKAARKLVGPDKPLPAVEELILAIECVVAEVRAHREAGNADAMGLYRQLWLSDDVLRKAMQHPSPEHAYDAAKKRLGPKRSTGKAARAGPSTPDPRYGRVEPKPWNEYDTSEEF